MKLKVDGKNYKIKKVSELNVQEYSAILSGGLHRNILTYISAMIGRDIQEDKIKSNIDLMEMKRRIFDVSFGHTGLDKPNAIIYEGETYPLELLFDKTFGSKYCLESWRQIYGKGDITLIELYVFSVATMLEKQLFPGEEFEPDNIFDWDLHMSRQKEIYDKLILLNWTKIIPTGFFFLKNLASKKNYLMMLLRYLTTKLQLMNRKRKMKKPKTRTT